MCNICYNHAGPDKSGPNAELEFKAGLQLHQCIMHSFHTSRQDPFPVTPELHAALCKVSDEMGLSRQCPLCGLKIKALPAKGQELHQRDLHACKVLNTRVVDTHGMLTWGDGLWKLDMDTEIQSDQRLINEASYCASVRTGGVIGVCMSQLPPVGRSVEKEITYVNFVTAHSATHVPAEDGSLVPLVGFFPTSPPSRIMYLGMPESAEYAQQQGKAEDALQARATSKSVGQRMLALARVGTHVGDLQMCWQPAVLGSMALLLNTHCEPTMKAETYSERFVKRRRSHQRNIMMLTPQHPDQWALGVTEATWDYSATTDDPDQVVECRCGSAACKRWVVKLDPETASAAKRPNLG